MARKSKSEIKSSIEEVLMKNYNYLAKHLAKLKVEAGRVSEEEIAKARKVCEDKITPTFVGLAQKDYLKALKNEKLDEDELYSMLEESYKKAYKTTVEEFNSVVEKAGLGFAKIEYSLRDLSKDAIDKAEEMLEVLKSLSKDEISKL